MILGWRLGEMKSESSRGGKSLLARVRIHVGSNIDLFVDSASF